MKHQLKKLVTPGLLITAFACIAVGCWWERPSLGLIVPAGLILGVYTLWWFMPLWRRKE